MMLGVFLVATCVAWLWLGWNEGWKRSCVPEGDCLARHQFNALERLDQKLFGYYNYLTDKPE